MSTYLDHNATSPMLPAVREAVTRWLGVPANPSSVHRAGQRARAAVEEAREHVAALVGGRTAGVVFTSGATEAAHTWFAGAEITSVAVSAVEHPCVHAAAQRARDVRRMPVNASGVAQLDAIPSGVSAVALQAANHETGVIQPFEQLLQRNLRVLVDATQAAGRIPLSLERADGVMLSAHKLGGPGGIGALILPDGDRRPALLGGGAQERGRRGGTVHTAGVVGFGVAARLAIDERVARVSRWAGQSERIRAACVALGARVLGHEVPRLANTTCVVFPGISGEWLVQALDLRGIMVSSGAACASGSVEASPVLIAMGEPEPGGGVRVSLGPHTADADVDRALAALPEVVRIGRSGVG